MSLLSDAIENNEINDTESIIISDFVLVLACCHTVIVDSENGQYQSESPDEEALVKAAADLGFTFKGRSVGKVLLQKGVSAAGGASSSGQQSPLLSYDLLATVPFDSTRKRMSVVVRRPDRSLVLYSKGADNIMFNLSSHFIDEQYRSVPAAVTGPKEAMLTHMDCFGSDGLRTLVLAKRELTPELYAEFSALWSKAEKSIIDREKHIATAAALVECELTVLGATAIEDKLQQDVPSTISHIHSAGIKLWVLTGDKMETAINIGYSSKLLSPEMILIKLAYRGEEVEQMQQKLSK